MQPWLQTEKETLFAGNSLDVLKTLPDCSVQCVVTSPPYWALRDYGVDGQLGLEKTPEEFIANMVTVFCEVRRVLRDDGTCWINIGDSYNANTGSGFNAHRDTRPHLINNRVGQQAIPESSWNTRRPKPEGIKQKDLVGIPWMLAFALRADGWYLRSEIIWHKRSPMPESVKDRPTKSHEQIFLLTKSPRYFYDVIGSQEAVTGTANSRGHGINLKAKIGGQVPRIKQNESFSSAVKELVDRRNMRTVWSLTTFSLKAAHFAAYPPELVRRCLSAGISEKGCCKTCGKPWLRITEKKRVPTRPGNNSKVGRASQYDDSPYNDQNGMMVGNRDPQRHVTKVETVGWKPDCSCDRDFEPCTVLDPFHGAGTTWKVCQRLGAKYIGVELNPEYLQLSVDRPAVYFPHERKKSTKKRRLKNKKQPELF